MVLHENLDLLSISDNYQKLPPILYKKLLTTIYTYSKGV
jgi:hypothetical protein